MIDFLKENYGNLFLLALSIVSVAEIVVRFTPTTKDDSAVERIGSIIRKIMDFFKIPNIKK